MLPLQELQEATDDENKVESISAAAESFPPQRTKLTHSRSQSSNLIHHHDPMTPKEQKKIATDMFNQMKHLKEQNEAIGYHGFSGYLERHNSRTMRYIGAISDNEDTDNEEDEDEPDPDKKQKQIKQSEDDHLFNRLYHLFRPALRIFGTEPVDKSSSILSVIEEEDNNTNSGSS